MIDSKFIKMGLVIGLIILFIVSALGPLTFGYSIKLEESINPEKAIQLLDNSPMNSSWPMYCHDVRHTGRSPYSTANNPGDEKWRFDTFNEVSGSPVIDDDGNIYIGSRALYAIYPNGTLKWKYYTNYHIESAPAIDEEGVIYFGTVWGNPYLFAVYMSNGTLKWKYYSGDSIFSSPAIGADGCIYFGNDGSGSPPYSGFINALYPNGTLKWRYKTNHFVHSEPAIGDDGIVYCGSHDGYLYALYPNNGSLKWKYKTGDWVARGPSIADDGTIYFGSWDGYLYAVYPNGTLKWKTGGNLAGTNPVIAQDGTIYVGNRYLTAINPGDGSIKWSFDPGPERTIRGGNPCISAEGIIYFGTHIGATDGGELIAVNPDGTERWRIMLATDWIMSAPAIGEDGTVYVGSYNDGYHPGSWGYLHAVGELDSNAPSAPDIDGPTKGVPDVMYNFTFKALSPLGNDLYYWIEWGDNRGTGWLGPYESGQEIIVGHEWRMNKVYTIKARAKDTDNLWGPWGTFEVTMPRNKASYSHNSLFLRFLERFPLLEEFISRIINPLR